MIIKKLWNLIHTITLFWIGKYMSSYLSRVHEQTFCIIYTDIYKNNFALNIS